MYSLKSHSIYLYVYPSIKQALNYYQLNLYERNISNQVNEKIVHLWGSKNWMCLDLQSDIKEIERFIEHNLARLRSYWKTNVKEEALNRQYIELYQEKNNIYEVDD